MKDDEYNSAQFLSEPSTEQISKQSITQTTNQNINARTLTLQHEQTLDKLVYTLTESGNFSEITPRMNYVRGEHVGEVDVFAKKGDVAHFFEVKATDSKGSYAKACKQYFRFCISHPEYTSIIGHYVTPTKECELPPIAEMIIKFYSTKNN